MPRMSDAKNRGMRGESGMRGTDSDKLPLLLGCGMRGACRGKGSG